MKREELMRRTLQAISNDCENWINEEMDISAEDLMASIRDAADNALENQEVTDATA